MEQPIVYLHIIEVLILETRGGFWATGLPSPPMPLHVKYQKKEGGSEKVIPTILERFPGKLKFVCKILC